MKKKTEQDYLKEILELVQESQKTNDPKIQGKIDTLLEAEDTPKTVKLKIYKMIFTPLINQVDFKSKDLAVNLKILEQAIKCLKELRSLEPGVWETILMSQEQLYQNAKDMRDGKKPQVSRQGSVLVMPADSVAVVSEKAKELKRESSDASASAEKFAVMGTIERQVSDVPLAPKMEITNGLINEELKKAKAGQAAPQLISLLELARDIRLTALTHVKAGTQVDPKELQEMQEKMLALLQADDPSQHKTNDQTANNAQYESVQRMGRNL